MKWWTVFIKEVKIFTRDKGALIQFFLVPILVITLANYGLQKFYQGRDGMITIPVVDLDQTQASRQLLEELRKIGIVRLEQTRLENGRSQPMTEARAVSLITKTHERTVAIVIPEKFEARILARQPVQVRLLENPWEKIGPDVTRSFLDATAGRITLRTIPAGSEIEWQAPKFTVKPEPLLNGAAAGMNSLKQNVPGFAIMFALFSLVWGSMSIVMEREKGTFARLLSAPVSKFEILTGKLLMMFAIACAQLLVFFSFGHYVFGMDMGRSPAGLVLLSMTLAFTATSLGVFLASFAKNQMQLGAISSIVVLGMSALGGSWWPSEFMPDLMQKIAHFVTINAWAMDGYKNLLWYGGDFFSILPQVGMLAAFGLCVFSLGLWKFKFE